ncbi:phosphoglucosamine mutase [Calothrix sp. NIES-4071]|nr:phosphoglucosamine mutase [Calothrix sp. NIES-4071]BAZ55858.1 phosphoglucosamine mutase [Calothrix sp. NIES-4105]
MVSFLTKPQSDFRGASSPNNSNLGLNTAIPTTPLFGTDGIRGRVGDLLTAPIAVQVGFWTGIVLRSHAINPGPVILGQDSRNSSDMLAMALSAGLTAAGVEVWYLGLCPTPCVAYLTSISSAIGGVMISASHNPPEDNGIKVFGALGGKLSKELQAEIEAGLQGNSVAAVGHVKCGRHYTRPEMISEYAESLIKPLRNTPLKGMKIVLDLAWGAAVGLGASVFKSMGAEVICMHNKADGDRINVNCGSTHLELLQQVVVEHGAHMGFGFDGDADRVLAVDNSGRIVDGDYILFLWGNSLVSKQQLPEKLIVSTVMANLGFERAWNKLGGTLTRSAVGDQYVQAEMLKTGGMLGGEQSGHILCRHYGITGDGLLTALHIAALVRESGETFSELVNKSFTTYPQILKNVRVEDRNQRMAWQQCQPLMDAIANAETAMGDSGRVLVRPSGTEPLIRVMVEAEDAELTQYWTDTLVAAAQKHLVC